MKTIWKKILPWYFEAVRNGSKTFEIRKDEDGFEVGDHIILCEWSGTAYTGFTLEAEVTYILRDAEQYGLMPGFCIFGIKAFDGKNTNVPAKDDAIPVPWIEAQIKKLRDMDNGFASLSAGQIEAMLKKWREEQNVRKSD